VSPRGYALKLSQKYTGVSYIFSGPC
jgi:hypothetical protein